MFTPYSFIFLSLYNVLLLSLFTISNFYYYWMVMELMMLLFMGLSYTLFVSSYSQLMSYFLIQAISSFSILLSYMYDSSFMFTVSLLVKLSMFPFHSWYINVIYRFPNFMVWMSGTLHKIPLLLMLFNFHIYAESSLLWSSMIMTTFISGVMMLMVLDFRMLLILSSVGNNSWMLLSQMTNLTLFIFFMLIYSISFFFILSHFKGLSKYPNVMSLSNDSYSLSFWVLSTSGMPPLPLFYPKMLVLLSLISSYPNTLLLLFLISSSFMLMGYLQSLMKFFIYNYSTSVHIFLKY